MDLIKCPVCGEKYSSSYRRCPFCEEEDRPRKVSGKRRGGHHVAERKHTHSARGPLIAVLLVVLAVSAGAASSQNVGVKFWKERSDKESMANSGIDSNRTATLTRQANGTYTLTLPVMQVSKLGVTGYLSGLTIGDVTYDGTLTGDFNKTTAVLTIKNLPASVLTGSDVNKSVLVTCNIQMDLQVLGEINTSARMCIWNQK